MSTVVRALDNRFSTSEMVTASDLQGKSIGRIQERLKASHKLLVTHYNRPVGILLGVEVFNALLDQVEELEERLERLEAAHLIDRRLEIPDSEWVSATPEQFSTDAERILLEKFRDGRRGDPT